MPESVSISTAATASGPPVVFPTNAQPACPSAIQPPRAAVALAPYGEHSVQPRLPTPVRLNKLRPFLATYCSRHDTQVLFEGFTTGFRLGYTGPRVSTSARNLVSARQNKEVLQGKIDRELHLGRIAGPFPSPPFPNLRCSPIGLVPKQTPGEFRLIHNLSSPLGDSVNDHIDPAKATVSYTSFDDAVELVSSLGPGALMAKSDIKSAFRLLPVHPDDYDLLGFSFNGAFYYDKCMPMGCSISCATFERFSTFLEYCTRKVSNTPHILHYLDDFFFAGRGQSNECAHALTSFIVVCRDFGVPLASDKTVGPATSLDFLGLTIDTVAQQIQVPSAKVLAILAKLDCTLTKRKVTLRELQSLLGSLNFVCKAIRPGRAFLRRLFHLTSGIQKPHHRIRISSGARADMLAWREFLFHFNGSVMFPRGVWYSSSNLHLYTDASQQLGFGAFFKGSWTQGMWPLRWRSLKLSIAFLELFPITLALRLWGPALRNQRVILWCDNEAVVAIINSQTSGCPRIMKLVRMFVVLCLKLNIHFKARHVPGNDNGIADALSRFQMERFRRLAPAADPVMTPLPADLWNNFN